MGHRKWATNSLRVQACNLRKLDPTLTDEQILQRFIQDGKLTASKPSSDSNSAKIPPNSPPNPSAGPLATTIDEELWEKCILRLVNEAREMTPAIVDKVKDYLDKKDAIVSTKADENIPYTPEELIQQAEDYINHVNTRDHPPTAVP